MNAKNRLNTPVLTIEHLKNVIESGNENAYATAMQLVEKPLLEITLTHTRGNQTKAAETTFKTDSKVLEVYEYCNLHGLWKK